MIDRKDKLFLLRKLQSTGLHNEEYSFLMTRTLNHKSEHGLHFLGGVAFLIDSNDDKRALFLLEIKIVF